MFEATKRSGIFGFQTFSSYKILMGLATNVPLAAFTRGVSFQSYRNLGTDPDDLQQTHDPLSNFVSNWMSLECTFRSPCVGVFFDGTMSFILDGAHLAPL